MTMTTVKLGGRLGQEFGQVWHLDIDRPSEAIRAIEANKPGFVKRIQELSDMGLVFRLRLNKRAIDDTEFDARHGGQTVTLMPIVRGSGATGRFIVGAVITVVGAMYGNQYAVQIGASLMIGGVVEMLSPQQKIGTSSTNNALSSYSFGSSANVAGQGYAIPVGYGRMLVGSIAVAAGIYAENMGSYTNTNPTLS